MGFAAHSSFTNRGIARIRQERSVKLLSPPKPVSPPAAEPCSMARYQLVVDTFTPLKRRDRFTMREIMDRIARACGVTSMEIRSPSRAAYLMLPRHAFFYWARRLTGKSYPQIGGFCGGRDHTTALHGARVYPKKRREMGRHVRRLK